MASLFLLILGLLLTTSDGFEEVEPPLMEMEQQELSGLYEVLNSLLDDQDWAQMHPQPCSETPWPGLQCEVGQENLPLFHVTKIHIGLDITNPPCKPFAKIPTKALLKLPYLKTLSIFNCFISPVYLPSSLFTSSSSLEHLTLKSNPGLQGTIPPTLGQITSLRVLSLSQNGLQGQIPKELNGLVSLEQLDLSYNNLTGQIPQHLQGLRNLLILDLSYNFFKGKIPSFLGQIPFLQKIDLSYNMLEGIIPKSLGKLKRLVLLDLSHNLINGPIPEALSGLEELECLMIEGNPIQTELPIFITALNKLTVIRFSGCELFGPIPTKSWSNLKNLKSLYLDGNNLNGTIPSELGTMPNLCQMNLSQNRLSGEVILKEEFINRIGNRLDVSGNDGLCIKKSVSISISISLEIPYCVETNAEVLKNKGNNGSGSLVDQTGEDSSTLKKTPSSSSSRVYHLHQNLIISLTTFLFISVMFLVV
ncbi:receptor like protein 29-like [Impatiens glandulifera]|uniref:receptor like protein 29-like n=1 Tax=Impatiens glandulifera TaxID=253017 RepID=UPI001FB07648|nr:receptor like protein 29-like [Impatiens glandulifera]